MFDFFASLFGRSDKWDKTESDADDKDPENYYRDEEPFTIMDWLKRH